MTREALQSLCPLFPGNFLVAPAAVLAPGLGQPHAPQAPRSLGPTLPYIAQELALRALGSGRAQ